MIEGNRTRVVVGVAAVAVGWKHRATLLSYATLPARAFVGVARAWCRGERHAGPGSRVVAAAETLLLAERSKGCRQRRRKSRTGLDQSQGQDATPMGQQQQMAAMALHYVYPNSELGQISC